MILRSFFALSWIVPVLALAESPTLKLDLAHRWVYCGFNLVPDEECEALFQLMRRAAKAGYTGIVLADFKLGHLDMMDDHCFHNVERTKALAAELGLEIVPAIFVVGWGESLLRHDPNLAQGLPRSGHAPCKGAFDHWHEQRLGNPMLIAGYYDASPGRVRKWLDTARAFEGVTGVTYTTWQNKYEDLERFAEIVREYR